jgi:hypothetical protein
MCSYINEVTVINTSSNVAGRRFELLMEAYEAPALDQLGEPARRDDHNLF